MEPEIITAILYIVGGVVVLAAVLAMFVLDHYETYIGAWAGCSLMLSLFVVTLFGFVKMLKWMWSVA